MPAQIPVNPSEISLNDREQMQYLLGGPPSWMLRYGIGALAGFFFLLLAMSWYFKYPDVLESKVVITTDNPPIHIPVHAGGRIEYLCVQENQAVRAGALLAVLESPARWENVVQLEQWLQQPEDASAIFPDNLSLGTLQNTCSVFRQRREDYYYFKNRESAAVRIAALQEQIGQLGKINNNLRKQNSLLSEEFDYATTNRQRQKQLHAGQVISDQDLEKSETAWLGQKRQMTAAEATILQNELQMKQMRQQMAEIARTESDQLHDKHVLMSESREQLGSEIKAWKQQFLLEAPVNGRVTFPVARHVHESVQAGDELLAIVPYQTQRTIAQAQVPAASLGRIRSGARAMIAIDGWPSMQFGLLESRVAKISAVPKEDTYLIHFQLPDSMVTTYHKLIPLQQEMPGTVRVITEERRLLERIFDRVSDLLKNR